VAVSAFKIHNFQLIFTDKEVVTTRHNQKSFDIENQISTFVELALLKE